MKDKLAKHLLGTVIQWDVEELTKEKHIMQLLSDYKYDGYEQFSPGMRFIENLSLWLNQFENMSDKNIAYRFIKNNLIFISTKELNHLISITYSTIIKPYIMDQVSKKIQCENYFVTKIINNEEFRKSLRKCLILGLSDGSRLDILRRSSPKLLHEQIYATYLINDDKSKELKKELCENIPNEKYDTIFLIDDFSGSGISYIRKKNDNYVGKLAKFYEQICVCPNKKSSTINQNMNKLFDIENLKIFIILYIATKESLLHIETNFRKLVNKNIEINVSAILILEDDLKLDLILNNDFENMLKKKFDSEIIDSHYKKGKHDKPHLGFNECGLSLIMNHNTPNNSLPILWHDDDSKNIFALFPRTKRYRVPID